MRVHYYYYPHRSVMQVKCNNDDYMMNLNAGFTYLQQQEQTEFVKVFLFLFQFVN